jgi:hypothetical protein
VQQPGDPIPKQEVDMDRSNDRSTENLAPMKEDMPWNRCC